MYGNNKKNEYLFQGSFTEIIDYGFRIYIEGFKNFIVVSLFSYIPVFLLLFVTDTYLVAMGKQPGSSCFSLFLSLAVTNNPFVWAGESLIIYMSGLYIIGHPEKVKYSANVMKEFVWRYLAFKMLYLALVISLLGLFFIIIPVVLAIYFAFSFALGNQVIVLENCQVISAFGRSVELARRHFGKVVLVLFLTRILLGIPHNTLALFTLWETAHTPWVILLIQAISAIITILIAPLSHIIQTFLFFDIKLRDEGIDMYLEAERMEKRFGFTLNDQVELMRKMSKIRITKEMIEKDVGKKMPDTGSQMSKAAVQIFEAKSKFADQDRSPDHKTQAPCMPSVLPSISESTAQPFQAMSASEKLNKNQTMESFESQEEKDMPSNEKIKITREIIDEALKSGDLIKGERTNGGF